jgi:hypothetical protein
LVGIELHPAASDLSAIDGGAMPGASYGLIENHMKHATAAALQALFDLLHQIR